MKMIKKSKFRLLAGPCVIESEENVMFLANALKTIADRFDVDFFFKASWDNRFSKPVHTLRAFSSSVDT